MGGCLRRAEDGRWATGDGRRAGRREERISQAMFEWRVWRLRRAGRLTKGEGAKNGACLELEADQCINLCWILGTSVDDLHEAARVVMSALVQS